MRPNIYERDYSQLIIQTEYNWANGVDDYFILYELFACLGLCMIFIIKRTENAHSSRWL